MIETFDIIVIGAGHAGCEAAHAAAKMGSKVLLLTMDMGKIAQMSCNPAMGGIAKGQIVREIDALGGCSAIVTDSSTIQFRMLNHSKGPAMWSPRAQCDRHHFSLNWRHILENTPNLSMWQGVVNNFIIKNGNIVGVRTDLGSEFFAKCFILTAGTFLNGKLFIGRESSEGGRIGELSSHSLTEQLLQMGIMSARMKTGTPMRIDARSVNFSLLNIQYGDESPERFSFLPELSPIQNGVSQRSCYIGYTNREVHDILKRGFKDSPLFSGRIEGIGPRYCPSIEDKLITFAEKESHQLFLEPEGWNTTECYLQGFSSSLPLEIQKEALSAVPGFENASIFRPGYAVEYDYFPPTQLKNNLESKIVKNLFFAGQVNGTTGYEEAAAQGLMAGINAHLNIVGKPSFILKRDQAYIGVLIDDLVTKGVDEPYRMFTSRAEYRILLRQDNADERLSKYSYELGLATDFRYLLMKKKYLLVESFLDLFNSNSLLPSMVNELLKSKNSSPISQKKKVGEILLRPDITIDDLFENVPRETFLGFVSDYKRDEDHERAELVLIMQSLLLSCDKKGLDDPALIDAIEKGEMACLDFLKGKDLCKAPYLPSGSLRGSSSDDFVAIVKSFSKEVFKSVEIRIKYEGYIERERRVADKMLRLEGIRIPVGFDYSKISSISTEARQKLIKLAPETISQASRIPGVSPSDISVLLVYFGR